MSKTAEIGARLNQARKILGHSAKSLAEAMGIPDQWSSFYNWERRVNTPLEVLAGMHELGIDLNWLITGVGSPCNNTLAGVRLKEAGVASRMQAEGRSRPNTEELMSLRAEVQVGMTSLNAKILTSLARKRNHTIGYLLEDSITEYCQQHAFEAMQ